VLPKSDSDEVEEDGFFRTMVQEHSEGQRAKRFVFLGCTWQQRLGITPCFGSSQLASSRGSTGCLPMHSQPIPISSDPERIGHPRERRDEILQGVFDKANTFVQVRSARWKTILFIASAILTAHPLHDDVV